MQHSKRIIAACLGVITVAVMLFGIWPAQPAKAAPQVTWINRGTVKVDADYFVDPNTTDVTLEYIGTPAALEGCPAKIVFEITPPDRSTQGAYTNFFYLDGFNNNTASRAQYQAPGGARDVNNKLVCDFSHKENVSVGQTQSRKVTFVRTDADTITNFRNNIIFKKTPVDEKVFRRTTGEADPCVDAIYLKEARVNVGSVTGGPWPNGTLVGGSAMLYALKNGGGGRKAESYADIMRRTTDPGYIKCGIDNGDMYVNDRYATSINVGDDERSVQFQIANGVKTNGDYYTSGNQDDDTFVIFIGTPAANLPTTPGGQPQPPSAPPATTLQPVCEDEGGGLAYIICPIINTIQAGFQFLFNEFILPFVGLTPAGSLTGLQQVWQNILGLANIAFIIVFFIIIFSQATSIGVSNYGIKRMLPRLIIVAILSNLSFYICAFLIDFANILGVGISSLILTPLQGLGAGSFRLEGNSFEHAIGLMAGLGFAGSALAASGGIIAGVFALAIIIGIMLIVAILLLLLRQVLIFTYIAFSPLVFVGFILPGTARISSRLTMGFLNLLWVGPIIMGMVALSSLVIIIIQSIPI